MKPHLLLLVGFSLRLVIWSLGLSETLSTRIEFTTRDTSFKSVAECIFLLSHSPLSDVYVNEYGCVIHPIVIFVMKPLVNMRYLANLVWIGADMLCAILLYYSTLSLENLSANDKKMQLLEESQDKSAFRRCYDMLCSLPYSPSASGKIQSSSSSPTSSRALLVMATYLLLPFTILACVSLSLSVLFNLFIVLSFWIAVSRKTPEIHFFRLLLICACMAVVIVGNPHYAILLIPLSYIWQARNRDGNGKLKFSAMLQIAFITLFVATVFTVAGTYLLKLIFSFGRSGRDSIGIDIGIGVEEVKSVLWSVYGSMWRVSSLKPNVGVFWYFFQEVFLQYRSFFMFVFHYHPLIYVLPLSIYFRGRYSSHFLFFVFIAILSIFKAYPTLSDTSLCAVFMLMFRNVTSRMRSLPLVSGVMVGLAMIGPMLWESWIYQGSSNVNFFYFGTVVFAVVQIVILVNSIRIALKFDV